MSCREKALKSGRLFPTATLTDSFVEHPEAKKDLVACHNAKFQHYLIRKIETKVPMIVNAFSRVF